MAKLLSLGQFLRRKRKEAELTQYQVADAVRCRQATVSLIENDQNMPSLCLARRLCALYGISLDDLPLNKKRATP